MRAVNPEAEGTTLPRRRRSSSIRPGWPPSETSSGRPRACRRRSSRRRSSPCFPRVIADPALGLDFSRVRARRAGVRADATAREGETLTVRARIDSIKVRGGTGFLVIAMDLFDERRRARRSDPVDDDRAERRHDAPLDDVSVGDELPELRRVVTRRGREGLRRRERRSEPAAPERRRSLAASGFDGVIAHGMFTMGHMAACVVSWAGDADGGHGDLGTVPCDRLDGSGDRGGRARSARVDADAAHRDPRPVGVERA